MPKLYAAGSWLYYTDSTLNNESPYKLHIALPIEHFEKNWQKVNAILKKAADAGIIMGFKVINWGSEDTIRKILPSSQLSYQQNKFARVGNNPFTIYLFDETEIGGVKKLIKEVDDLLQEANVPGSNPSHLSAADLPLKSSSHFTLRQASLDGDYVAVGGASEEELHRLKQEVMQTEVYQALNGEQNSKIDIKPNDAENIAFYNQNYNRLETGLASKDINTQFNHAAWLFSIDIENFKKTEVVTNLAKIKKTYFRLSMKYHPDKSGQQAQTAATKMTQLLNQSRDLLNEVAKNPQFLLDTKDILAQVPYAPKYQYELDTFAEDPYVYIRMARSSNIIIIKENWVVNLVETMLNNALVVYNQNISIHEIAKRISIPGYQAFWLLFKAGALPRRFDQGHLHMALNDCSAWLIEKMLTNEFSLLWLDSDDVFSLAKKATEKGIVKIGLTDEDVFIYFFEHYPETLYGKRIDKIIVKGVHGITKINRDIIEAAILNNKENLAKLGQNGLDEIAKNFPKVKAYILSRKDLCLRFSTHYWHYEYNSLRKPNPPILSGNEWKQWCALNLMDGRIECLRILSLDSIKALKDYLINNEVHKFPEWLVTQLQEYIETETAQVVYLKDLLTEQFSKKHVDSWGTHIHVSPLEALFKAIFANGQLDLLAILNQKTLFKIANHQDCTWPIIYMILTQAPSLISQLPLREIQVDDRKINSWQELLDLKIDVKSIATTERNNLLQSLLKEYEFAARANTRSIRTVIPPFITEVKNRGLSY